MRDFRTLRVWQHGHRFVLDVYAVTRAFPAEERQGVTAQLRRAAASITSTLAEGAGAFSDADQRRFFRMSFRSACETLNHLILSHDLGYRSATDYARLESALASIRKMLWRLIERSQD